MTRNVSEEPDRVNRSIDAVWRIESAKLIASLVGMVRDVGVAEELAQDALVAALEQWPSAGIPERPGAWLLTIAKRRAIDRIRRNVVLERKHEELMRDAEAVVTVDFADRGDDIEDDLVRLMFIAAHPILAPEARVALTLRLLGGLTTKEIARAFLTPEDTIAQRIVRAKRTLTEARVPFEVPQGAERVARLTSVLAVIYLIFNEGYAASSGDDWMRPRLCEDALRLGRILAELVPAEPEVHGLVALMELQASRMRARVDARGAPILLLDQNRARWDHVLIARGLVALARAEHAHTTRGPYELQAAIAAIHARAKTSQETDWERIAALYDGLAELIPSPVVELNRAVALGMAYGPAVGLDLVEQLHVEGSLDAYHLLFSVHGDLLFKLGRYDEACGEFERAASLTQNRSERALLQDRAASARAARSTADTPSARTPSAPSNATRSTAGIPPRT